jgi:hypothetical protein
MIQRLQPDAPPSRFARKADAARVADDTPAWTTSSSHHAKQQPAGGSSASTVLRQALRRRVEGPATDVPRRPRQSTSPSRPGWKKDTGGGDDPIGRPAEQADISAPRNPGAACRAERRPRRGPRPGRSPRPVKNRSVAPRKWSNSARRRPPRGRPTQTAGSNLGFAGSDHPPADRPSIGHPARSRGFRTSMSPAPSTSDFR